MMSVISQIDLLNQPIGLEPFGLIINEELEYAVGVAGVYVGEGAAAENLAKLFGLECGEKIGEMSADKVGVSFGEPVGGKVRLTAGPKGGAPQAAFFMRVKMTPQVTRRSPAGHPHGGG